MGICRIEARFVAEPPSEADVFDMALRLYGDVDWLDGVTRDGARVFVFVYQDLLDRGCQRACRCVRELGGALVDASAFGGPEARAVPYRVDAPRGRRRPIIRIGDPNLYRVDARFPGDDAPSEGELELALARVYGRPRCAERVVVDGAWITVCVRGRLRLQYAAKALLELGGALVDRDHEPPQAYSVELPGYTRRPWSSYSWRQRWRIALA